MFDLKYYLYGKIQWLYHAIKGRNVKDRYNMFYTYDIDDNKYFEGKSCAINGQSFCNNLLFKGDNIVEGCAELPISKSYSGKAAYGKKDKDFKKIWLNTILNAKVEPGWNNSGLYLTAYTKENKQWCLSNWIWTSAAISRVLSQCDHIHEAVDIADEFLKRQSIDGYWVVRYDFVDGHLNRLAAPNDSAYIARNALLTAYHNTGEIKYLESAEKCARWIINTACADGMVMFGYNVDSGKWITNRNIVDIGFTADLFAELFSITGNETYMEFMSSFINSYINAFYDSTKGLFGTHINADKRMNGGYFSRGQAWAMEGLIPVYLVTKDKALFELLETVTKTIAEHQKKDGGWYCNFQRARSLMGEDCKGVSVIAFNLLRWAAYSKHPEILINASKRALKWCEKHTDLQIGTILSFSCNGAIAHSPNTSTGMLYANAYAIELQQLLSKY